MQGLRLLHALWFSLAITGAASGLAETVVRRTAIDHFEILVDRPANQPLTLLQVTDLHLGKKDFWKQDLTTFKRIRRVVETTDPAVVVITGDLLTGEKYFGSLLAAFAVDFFDSLKRPWVYTFGNHDVEGGFGRDEIYEVFSNSPWCVFGYHAVTNEGGKKYDFVADLKHRGAEGAEWQIYGFDSGSAKGFKSIKADQLAWFRAESERTRTARGQPVPALAAFHIPLKEFDTLWKDPAILKHGEHREDVSFEEDDGAPYRAFVEAKNIRAVLCGHDHFNNYWGKTKEGIVLAYGHISGEATHYAWPTGGRLVTLPLDGHGEISLETVTPTSPEK